MGKLVWDMLKVFVIFVACTLLFYFGLRTMHAEYEQYHRYDAPEGNSVKVFNAEDQHFIDRLNLFFRLGE
ncbi:YqzK family protein [Oceanobacillus halotolerans]|uniref:YqzK family protein n=1 Tax=Oceanobacillus halotolerans TaxID=2663380 RepID=UPI0013DB516F|nr:YqzK family protein [Oceanobacillus halotolerans]